MQTPEVHQTHIDPSPYRHADTIRRQMEGLAPGSEAERAVLEQVRAAKLRASEQIGHQAIQDIKRPEDQLQYTSPEESRKAHHLAVEQVTEEHNVPVVLH